jgi:hypothetical protein
MIHARPVCICTGVSILWVDLLVLQNRKANVQNRLRMKMENEYLHQRLPPLCRYSIVLPRAVVMLEGHGSYYMW